MADLVAQGMQTGERWRRTLPVDHAVVLGRAAGQFSAEWDDRISRRHAELRWRDGKLHVRRLPTARNPIFAQGSEVESLELAPGEHFVIGQTTFTVIEQRVQVSLLSSQPLREQSFTAQYLHQLQYRNARARIELLSRFPEVISGARSESELLIRLTNLLLAGIPTADAIALVRVADSENAPIEVLHWDRRTLTGGSFAPSERLIREAVARGESVLHVWAGAELSRFTAREDVDWAFCTPVLGEICRGWGIYVAGEFSGSSQGAAEASPTDPHDLRDDLKFTEVAAATLRSLQELRILQRRHAGLSQFFSPVVLDALAADDPDVVLAPREAEVTVLFCDLRGFSRETEKSTDNLLGHLERVSRALGVTTRQILEQGGVVGDFQGDAVMGFWGWPLSQPDAIERACTAALSIGAQRIQADDPLSGFQLGMGLATGRAVAGKIGTIDQVKVTVFGPVVNLASRLEGMTKILRTPILLDQQTAAYVRAHVPRQVARCRRLAVIQPWGLKTPLEVSELLPPESAPGGLSDPHIADYEAALDSFQAGRWEQAFKLLHRVPADDRGKDFLTVLIAQHNRQAPDDWDGVVRLTTK